MSEAEDYLQFDRVRVSAVGVSEMDGHHRILFLPASDITAIELSHQSGAERPLIMAVIGIALIPLALLPLQSLYDWFNGDGYFHLKYLGAPGMLILSWWLLDQSFRKRWVLLVHTRKGSRKVVFHTDDETGVYQFVTDARSRFGY